MIMTGFFNATQRRKRAFVSWGALKKPRSTDELPLHQYSLKGFGKRARLRDADEHEDAGARLMKVGNLNEYERLLICNILISFIIIEKVKYELDRKIQA